MRMVNMKKTLAFSVLIAAPLLIGAETTAADPGSQAQSGMASYYHDRFHGRRTASGARYDKGTLSAAHKTLPLGTRVLVTDSRSGRSVVVRINDRGPYHGGRIIDLSRAAANQIGLTAKGVGRVKLQILGRDA